MPKVVAHAIFMDKFVLDRVFDVSEREKAEKYLRSCRYKYQGEFEMKPLTQKQLNQCLRTSANPKFQLAIGQSYRSI